MKISASYFSGISKHKVDEVLFELDSLSRNSQLKELPKELEGDKKVLVWDILMTEGDFNKKIEIIKKIDLNKFDAIRAQDLGALEYIKEHFPHIPLQVNLESSFHNYDSIKTVVDYVGEQLDKIILSLELSKEILKDILSQFEDRKFSFELLGIGPLCLFYSPRNLLSPHFINEKGQIEVEGRSEETPHKGFRIVENEHGTFMYHPKDHLLLDKMDILESLGIDCLRINSPDVFIECLEFISTRDLALIDQIKQKSPRKFISGYFEINKSDALFPRLKNKFSQRVDKNYIGDILSAQKESYLAIRVQNKGLEVGDQIKIITTEGKEKTLKLKKMWNSAGDILSSAAVGQLVYTDFHRGVSKKARVYSNN